MAMQNFDPSNFDKLIYKFTTPRAVFFTRLTLRIYPDRVSLEYKPVIGGGETRKTFSAIDIGDVYVNKGFRWAKIGVHRINSSDILFEIRNLKKDEAEDLKNAFDKMLSYRYFYMTNQPTYLNHDMIRFQRGNTPS